MQASFFAFIVGANRHRNTLGFAFHYFAIYNYTFVFKSKGQRLLLDRNTSTTCVLELFKSQNNKKQVKRFAGKEVRENENYFNIFCISFCYSHLLQRGFNQVN